VKGSGIRILVVDDDNETRELLSRSLGDLGATVVGASSAAEARAEVAPGNGRMRS